MTDYSHIPVLLDPTLDNLISDPNGIYLDLTFGRGGHSRKILEQLGPQGRLIAIDQDPSAILAAQAISDPRFTIIHSRFDALEELAQELQITAQVTGILADIGTSSPQLDDPERGFSFNKLGALDMRMSSQGITARDWLLTHNEQQIANALWLYGEEKQSRRIARAIKAGQAQAISNKQLDSYLVTTLDLANLIAGLIKHEKHKHPATRSFQAIRIVVNQELEQLEAMLKQSLKVLKAEGRIAVITFHSLEDRIVKNFFRDSYQGLQPPRGLALTAEQWDSKSYLEKPYKAIVATAQEIADNPRSRSATLRVAVRNQRAL